MDKETFYSHFDIPVPGSKIYGGATIAVQVEDGYAVVGVALRSPLDQLWRKKGRNIALGRIISGTGRMFFFGVQEGAKRKDILDEARKTVIQSVRWQDYPFNRWFAWGLEQSASAKFGQ